MGDESAFYITSVAHGMVLARSPNGQPSGVVAQNRGDQDTPQKWVAEPGETANIVALRCLSTNDYLHANGGGNWATVGTGEKQWWKISNDNVTAPGACCLSPVDYPRVFLNHFQGIRVAKKQSMKVHMWQWEQPNEFCLSWYFFPAEGGFGPQAGASGASSKASDAKIQELESSKAASDAKLQDLEASKAASDAKLQDLEATAQSSAAKLQNLQDKLTRQSRDLDAAKAAAAKLADLESSSQSSAATLQDLRDKLARQSRELDDAKTAAQQHLDAQKAQDAQRAQKKAQKADDKMAKKEQKLGDKAQKKEQKKGAKALKKDTPQRLEPQPQPQEKVTVLAMNGVAKSIKREGCKHVVLPPPRKIRRKVVGIVYAQ